MAYLEVEIDVDEIDWECESEDTSERAIDAILDAHKGLADKLREKLKAPKLDPAYATRKAIERLPLEVKKKLFADLFSDMLPNELALVSGILIGKYGFGN